jgi:hypothetical protein
MAQQPVDALPVSPSLPLSAQARAAEEVRAARASRDLARQASEGQQQQQHAQLVEDAVDPLQARAASSEGLASEGSGGQRVGGGSGRRPQQQGEGQPKEMARAALEEGRRHQAQQQQQLEDATGQGSRQSARQASDAGSAA